MNEYATSVIWRRWMYALTPQWDIYVSLRNRFVGMDVLEVGFGTGAGVLQYASGARSVLAIEPDRDAVLFARETFPVSNVTWCEQDITVFTAPGVFDACVMIETLEHIHHWKIALANVRDSLRTGGELIITARNRNADLRRQKNLHEREWTAKEFYDSLSLFFGKVTLYDYSLTNEQDQDTALTPLVAIASKQDTGHYIS